MIDFHRIQMYSMLLNEKLNNLHPRYVNRIITYVRTEHQYLRIILESSMESLKF